MTTKVTSGAGSIEQRPYVGTWQLNNRSIVKYTPDALVYINGDVSVPGCPRCRGRVDLQQYVTSLSVDAGTEPTSHSATINLTLPRMQGQQLFIDGDFILRPGLEVHIFMRGYFPLKGMYSHLARPDFEVPNGEDRSRVDLSRFANYPYYPVFHGVITTSSYDYGDGFYNGTLNCASLLHFWRYQNISTSAAYLALDKKPENDPARPTLYGHNFNGMHPFGIIYTCYRDVAGAAAGVEFALSEASNLDAPAQSNLGGGQLYSQVVSYWEQRFRTRIQSLRMYGVNGQLFNAAQQAFLVNNSNNRDINALLPSTQYSDPENQRSEIDPFAVNRSTAKALGLTNAGPDLIWSPFVNQEGQQVGISLLDQWGFTPTIGEIGDVNLWQSTYQTKMDIAETVTDVTGYEFYQDVDGDLVFKPPFYNMDTSTNRFYRLEDIDIISINFQQKEPAATYIIVNGTWFKGLKDVVPNSQATRKRALYIDYKLVAQFGWRKSSLEITYTTDPKILFWIGIARMDLLNIDVNSAQCTIPIRAELRPGYPVYIPFVDSYYYISQLSHSFAFAGQCTTNLTLTCRRSKFHAPGFLQAPPPGKSALDLIRLDRPDLPPRPLSHYKNGFPRNIGFPNVVLALDPSDVNPNFSSIGIGFDYINTRQDVENLFNAIRRDILLIHPAVFEVPPEFTGPDGRLDPTNPIKPNRFRLRWGKGPNEYREFGLDELLESFETIQPGLTQLKGIRKSQEGILRGANLGDGVTQPSLLEARARENIWNAVSEEQGVAPPPDAARVNLERQNLRTQAASQQAQRNFGDFVGDASGPNGNLLYQVVTALNSAGQSFTKRKIDGLPQSDVTIAYYESLNHLKGQYTAGSIPGRYRYYSCSHPQEGQQGQPIMFLDDGDRENVSTPTPRGRGSRRGQRPVRRDFRRLPQDVQTLLDRMQVALDELDITWISAQGKTQAEDLNGNPVSVSKGVRRSDPLSGESRRAPEFLTPETAQNLVDIADVANRIRTNCLSDSRWPANRTIVALSTFRPNEGKRAEKMHALGVAMDLLVTDGQNEEKGAATPPDLRTAMDLLRGYALTEVNRGTVTGFGSYENSGSGWFVHVDRRSKDDVDTAPGLDHWFVENKSNVPLRVPFDPPRFDSQGNERFRRNPEWTRNQAELLTNWSDFGVGKPFKWNTYPDATPNSLDIFQDDVEVPPDRPAVPAPEPAVETEQAPSTPAPVGSVRTQVARLERPRRVIQFQVVSNQDDPEHRDVDVKLGIGTCSVGLNVATGPGRPPRILTTDQIQTMSFSFFNQNKFAQVVGTSPNSSSLTFNGNVLSSNLTALFVRQAEDYDKDSTAGDLFAAQYLSIKTALEGINIPIYDNQNLAGITQQEIDEAVRNGSGSSVTVQGQGAFAAAADVLSNVTNTDFNSSASITITQVALPDFEDAIVLPLSEQPAGVQQIYRNNGKTKTLTDANGDSTTAIDVDAATLGELSKTEPYAVQASNSNISQNLASTVEAVAQAYANVIVERIGRVFNEANNAAQAPLVGRPTRFGSIKSALDRVTDATVGVIAVTMVGLVPIPIKTPKEGKTAKPRFAPIFPISDEKGYEHFGAFRYGRGLSVEQGGTFEFLHSNRLDDDPFQNAGAQDVEAFVQALVLQQAGELEAAQQNLRSQRQAETDGEMKAIEELPDPVVDQPAAPPETIQRREREEALQAAVSAAEILAGTPQGREQLRNLLELNGDNVNEISQNNWDITDSQFARRFANNAVNYGKSPVFKTTAGNAAYQLSDITSHLLSRTGQNCVCRGNLADVMLAAYAQRNFITVDGIDTENDKATAALSEAILNEANPAKTQEDFYRGKVLTDRPDAEAFNRNQGGS